jgi:hypothetical protein
MKRILELVRHAGRVVLGKQRADRNLTVFEDDIFLVSYPRSGNTWTRFLLGNLLRPEDPVTFANVESRIPELYLFPNRVLTRLPRPRVLKSHEYFDPRYRKVIYIVRDPRDVAVSMYYYSIKRQNLPDGYPVGQFVPRFLAGEFLSDFGTWADHVLSWVGTRRGHSGFLMLRYEDMLEDAERELAKVAGMFGLRTDSQALRRVVELSSADRMRQLEKEQSKDWKLTKNTLQDKPFVRAAAAGNWQSTLPTESVAQIESVWGTIMQSLGYRLEASQTGARAASLRVSS